MRREDLRKLVREEGPPHKMVVTAPVTDAEALRTLLFDACGNYAPHANCNYLAACMKGMLHCNKCGFIEQCPACGGSGRVPKDGVVAFKPDRHWTNTADNVVSFAVPNPLWGVGRKFGNMPGMLDPIVLIAVPASMLDPEGDTDG